jgi:MSHA biogenesis protein MshN
MSLLNDMLQDLANQKPAKQVAPVLIPVLSKKSKITMKLGLLLSLALILLVLVGLSLFKQISVSEPVVSKQETAMVVPAISGLEIKPQPIKKPINYVSYIEPYISPSAERIALQTINDEPNDEVDAFNESLEFEAEPAVSSVNKVYRPQTIDEWHDALLDKAIKAIDQGFDEKAISYLQEILTKMPNSSDARENLASLYLSYGDYAHAKEVLNEGLVYAPVNAALITIKARLFMDQDNTAGAIKLLASHHPSMTEYPDYYATLAAALQSEGRVLEAGNIYKSLLQVDPNNGQYWLGYAISLEFHNKQHQAIEAYIRASKDPDIETTVRDYAENRLKTLQG